MPDTADADPLAVDITDDGIDDSAPPATSQALLDALDDTTKAVTQARAVLYANGQRGGLTTQR